MTEFRADRIEIMQKFFSVNSVLSLSVDRLSTDRREKIIYFQNRLVIASILHYFFDIAQQ